MKEMTGDPALSEIYGALSDSAWDIYQALRSEHGLNAVGHANATGDEQLELDVFANNVFLKQLSACESVRHAITEEQPDLVALGGGPFSIALDPLDGSKSALVGIPSGAIFCIFRDADSVSDFKGKNK